MPWARGLVSINIIQGLGMKVGGLGIRVSGFGILPH